MNRRLVLAAALVFLACGGDDPTEPSTTELQLRIANQTTDPVQVVATGQVTSGTAKVADFGSVGVGQTTGFRAMDASFTLTVNGETFDPGLSSTFQIDDTPTARWTLTLTASGSWSLEAFFGE